MKQQIQMIEEITYDFLFDNAKFIKSTNEHTCHLYEYQGIEYVVLPDNTVITRAEDNQWGDDLSCFPY